MTQTVTPVRDTSGADVARRRLRVLSALILVVGLTIAARLVWLQTAQADTYRAIAQQVQTDVVAVPAARGDIVDRTGQLLAGNRTSYEVAVESLVDDQTVAALVETLGYTGKRIAIERNGEIVPRGRHADTLLTEGDILEIVVAVGGG